MLIARPSSPPSTYSLDWLLASASSGGDKSSALRIFAATSRRKFANSPAQRINALAVRASILKYTFINAELKLVVRTHSISAHSFYDGDAPRIYCSPGDLRAKLVTALIYLSPVRAPNARTHILLRRANHAAANFICLSRDERGSAIQREMDGENNSFFRLCSFADWDSVNLLPLSSHSRLRSLLTCN